MMRYLLVPMMIVSVALPAFAVKPQPVHRGGRVVEEDESEEESQAPATEPTADEPARRAIYSQAMDIVHSDGNYRPGLEADIYRYFQSLIFE